MTENEAEEVWRIPIDRSQAPSREPGPIDLRRNFLQAAYSGIPTFMGVPVCLDQEDLRAGGVDVAVFGVPLDSSSGHRGAAYGPRALRSDERYLFNTPELMINPSTRVSPFDQLKVVDYGDAAVDIFSVEKSLPSIAATVREVAETGAVPVILGGDHSLMIASVGALADMYGPDKVGVVHFDAHPDCHEHIFGHRVTHGTPIWRLIEERRIPGRNFVQVGLRTPTGPDDSLFNWMRRNGLRTHFMVEIDRLGFPAVLDKVVEEILDGPEFVYLSLDIDVLDPAFAPGTGTPEPGGLTPRELFPAFRRICAETNVIGMDVVEIAPHLDPGYSTTMNARRAIFEGLTGLAMKKAGMVSPDYVNPIASGQLKFPLT
ncbi:agmatinase family protein [Streptomyces sp. NL15-2K]|uniref:agmatinase family protein n=1 Tax=Streptomyces sp. NL15-2K TaxID=376149 RepID=UPI000F58CBC5|nr:MULTISPECIES: agmatinase family protein [Actinomycetes]WKX14200.1 agmatinase family protein [Kutzneria buriramensis]GCB44640.1 agmatinase [Streptomyces sp. NL15-2K]